MIKVQQVQVHPLTFHITFVFLCIYCIKKKKKPSVVRQILRECGILSVYVGIWVVIQLDQLCQGRHAGIMVEQHCWQVGRFAFDAAGATNRSQKLEIFDVALSLGHTCARFSFDGLSDTEQNDMRKCRVKSIL